MCDVARRLRIRLQTLAGGATLESIIAFGDFDLGLKQALHESGVTTSHCTAGCQLVAAVLTHLLLHCYDLKQSAEDPEAVLGVQRLQEAGDPLDICCGP